MGAKPQTNDWPFDEFGHVSLQDQRLLPTRGIVGLSAVLTNAMDNNDIRVGMMIYYKMKPGERIYEGRIEKVSPHGKCFSIQAADGKGIIWVAVENIDIIDLSDDAST